MTIEYVLWPGDDWSARFDEFVVHGCRVRLMGAFLSVECKPADVTEATAVATEYADALRRRGLSFGRLITLDEYRTMPGRSVTIEGKTAQETSQGRERLREARRSIVQDVHPRLSQCYDYFQLACDEPKHAPFHIYKLVETIEADYGGEKKAGLALDANSLIKRLKRQANDEVYDQRHAPLTPAATNRIHGEPAAAGIDAAHDLLRKYEDAVTSAKKSP